MLVNKIILIQIIFYDKFLIFVFLNSNTAIHLYIIHYSCTLKQY